MFREYEKWAMEVIKNSKNRRPESEKDAERLGTAFTILAGAKGSEMLMGGQMGRYDGMGEDEEYRGGRGYSRVSGYERRRFDGEMDEREREEMYRGGGQGGYYSGGQSGRGGQSGGGNYSGGQSGGYYGGGMR